MRRILSLFSAKMLLNLSSLLNVSIFGVCLFSTVNLEKLHFSSGKINGTQVKYVLTLN